MRIFLNEIKGAKAYCFMDLEATSFTSELIEIGAVLAIIDKEGKVKKTLKPYKRYVIPLGSVGKPVRDLTGIDSNLLHKEGVKFEEAIPEFWKYIGKYAESVRFVTFGDYDMTILRKSGEKHRDFNHTLLRNIYKRHFDFQKLLGRYIQDEHGNPLSLKNYLKVFGIEFEGKEHDAVYDAINLMKLYEKAYENPSIFIEEYEKTLSHGNKVAPPVKKLISALNEGKSVTKEDWDLWIEETFQ